MKRDRHRLGRTFVALVALTVLSNGCSSGVEQPIGAGGLTDDEVGALSRTWVNSIGLSQRDPAVWTERLGQACTQGIWHRHVAERLAETFIAEDLPLSVRAEGLGPPSVGDAAQALWMMAAQTCREAFPPGELDQGPPTY